MKCKKCGYRAKDINGMRKHYMKAHPGAMKHRGPRKARRRPINTEQESYYEISRLIAEHERRFH